MAGFTLSEATKQKLIADYKAANPNAGKSVSKKEKKIPVVKNADANAFLTSVAGKSFAQYKTLVTNAKTQASARKELKEVRDKIKNNGLCGADVAYIPTKKITIKKADGSTYSLPFEEGKVYCRKAQPKGKKRDRAKCSLDARKEAKKLVVRADPKDPKSDLTAGGRCIAKWVRPPRTSAVYPHGKYTPRLPIEILAEAALERINTDPKLMGKGYRVDPNYMPEMDMEKAKGAKGRMKVFTVKSLSPDQIKAVNEFKRNPIILAVKNEGLKVASVRIADAKKLGTVSKDERSRIKKEAIADVIKTKGLPVKENSKIKLAGAKNIDLAAELGKFADMKASRLSLSKEMIESKFLNLSADEQAAIATKAGFKKTTKKTTSSQ